MKLLRYLLCGFLVTTSIAVASCSSTKEKTNKRSVTLVTYDSFPEKDTSLNDALDEFEKESGISVTIVNAGDTGTMLSKARLTSGNPEGDVMWGVDNTFLSSALEDNIFVSYTAKNSKLIPQELRSLAPDNIATPVDYGDVCINYDINYFSTHNLAVPTDLSDLTQSQYKNLLVTENPGTSSPGLAFLLATRARFGDTWEQYWEELKNNGVKIVDSWDSAYYESFSGSSGKGDYPLVVSYASSPVAEVIYADPPTTVAPTGNISSTCFRQVEFAGILRGTKHKKEAQELMDFFLTERFQRELPLTLFVLPSRSDIELAQEFTDYSDFIDSPFTMDPSEIAAHRDEWIDTWTNIVLN